MSDTPYSDLSAMLPLVTIAAELLGDALAAARLSGEAASEAERQALLRAQRSLAIAEATRVFSSQKGTP